MPGEAVTEGIDISRLHTYAETVLKTAKPYFNGEVDEIDLEKLSFKVKGVGRDGIYHFANIISEHLSLATTGFSDPEGVEIDAAQKDAQSPVMVIKRITYSDNRSEVLVEVKPLEQDEIEVISKNGNKELLSFVQQVVKAGLPLPERKLRPQE